MGFKLQSKKQSVNKTIRFPKELIDRMEKTMDGKRISFSSFVIQACTYALDQMEMEETES